MFKIVRINVKIVIEVNPNRNGDVVKLCLINSVILKRRSDNLCKEFVSPLFVSFCNGKTFTPHSTIEFCSVSTIAQPIEFVPKSSSSIRPIYFNFQIFLQHLLILRSRNNHHCQPTNVTLFQYYLLYGSLKILPSNWLYGRNNFLLNVCQGSQINFQILLCQLEVHFQNLIVPCVATLSKFVFFLLFRLCP